MACASIPACACGCGCGRERVKERGESGVNTADDLVLGSLRLRRQTNRRNDLAAGERPHMQVCDGHHSGHGAEQRLRLFSTHTQSVSKHGDKPKQKERTFSCA
jgi:hypothetical protein